MTNTDIHYQMTQIQLQKAIGELRAVAASWYDSNVHEGGSVYKVIHPMIEKFIDELTDNCG